MKFVQISFAAPRRALTGFAAAQSLKDRLVGTWDFVVAEVTAPDGKRSFPFGETPKGILIFTADGRFAQVHGTYTVDEEKKTVTYRIVSSSFPNGEGEA